MIIEVDTEGVLHCIYSDDIAELVQEAGSCIITRASNVEPVEGGWEARMKDGVILRQEDGTPFPRRDLALAAEYKYLEQKLFPKEENAS
jgi:hypothetical protein